MKATKVLVRITDYNGFKNVYWMMKSTDSRIGDGNYTKVSDVTYDRASKTLTTADGKTYPVASDHSVKFS